MTSEFVAQGCVRKKPSSKVLTAGPAGVLYDCILMDPPWENASAARGGRYPSLPNRKLLSIPVPSMLHQVQSMLWVYALLQSTLSAPW